MTRAKAVLLALFFIFFSAVSTVLLGILAATIVACALNPLLVYIPGPRGVGAPAPGRRERADHARVGGSQALER